MNADLIGNNPFDLVLNGFLNGVDSSILDVIFVIVDLIFDVVREAILPTVDVVFLLVIVLLVYYLLDDFDCGDDMGATRYNSDEPFVNCDVDSNFADFFADVGDLVEFTSGFSLFTEQNRRK